MSTKSFEKLGVFYLGKIFDAASANLTSDYLLYDSKDLITHALCVGMTGSGKTGLCITLLEEAAIDGIPAIVIDPKGDLSNLLLSFPALTPAEFRPWISEDAAREKGVSPDEFARAEAERWRAGLTQWDQDEERIQLMRSAVEFAIYTPGSTAGLPVSIASSFEAATTQYPPDPELLRDRISTTASGLLGLLGLPADPLRSREHILIAKILEEEWTRSRNLDLTGLIHMIQSPPFERVGAFDLESFFPSADRTELAMMLNNLLASPGFATWLEGEPLDLGSMLHSAGGKPRICIFSIAHLSDSERMFFVTLLLNQFLGWMRSQAGTASLRAILYMDEIFGYFPPVSEPPSKKPLLTLLKQARAYGVGIVLATQNPVDLDYKGLANAGTWFIGRLQTERDRDRLLDGLLGSGGTASAGLNRARLSEIIGKLQPRVFLMQNVHEDKPLLFGTRWALSYLPGPLTRGQIKLLMDGNRPAISSPADLASPVPPSQELQTKEKLLQGPPPFPPDVRQFYAPLAENPTQQGQIVCHPFLFASARVQVIDNKFGIASTEVVSHTVALQANMTAIPWSQAGRMPTGTGQLTRQPLKAAYLPAPTTIFEKKRFQNAQRGYIDFVYQESKQILWQSKTFKLTSRPEESERDFRIRLQQAVRERRDFELQRVRNRYVSKTTQLQQRLLRAQQRIDREQQQYNQQKMQTAISVGATLLGALMGRRTFGAGTLGRATTATRQASRIGREKEDLERALEEKESVERQLETLESQLREEAERLAQSFDAQAEELQQIVIRPAKKDILLQDFGILWLPFCHDAIGNALPLA